MKTKMMESTWIATVATELVSHLAIVAAMPDGEDSKGRQKLRLLTPKEVAKRAFEIASELWYVGVATGNIKETGSEEEPEK